MAYPYPYPYPYYQCPYPGVGCPAYGPCNPANIPAAGLGPKNEEKKPAYHLIEAANRMTQNLRNLMTPMSDMIGSSTTFGFDGALFSQKFHEFKGRFDETTGNASGFIRSMKNPAMERIANPQPTFHDDNYWKNLDKDVDRHLRDFDPIPYYPCPSEIKCHLRAITPPAQSESQESLQGDDQSCDHPDQRQRSRQPPKAQHQPKRRTSNGGGYSKSNSKSRRNDKKGKNINFKTSSSRDSQ